MAKKYIISVNGTSYEVVVEDADPNATYKKAEEPKKAEPAAAPAAAAPTAASAGGTQVNAPLPGTILKVLVSNGQAVKKGDLLCILEAMKMENEVLAPVDGTVNIIGAKQGASVNSGDQLFTIA
ncbi:biotin/lipoyl-binding protein [Eubacteriales bacterium OttesenSCG-928-G02]|nr:biotin/lipoyl-binding protein [Eubacteriales bacterium OttesenSCG-928-G02]